jgi:hypothetical protein
MTARQIAAWLLAMWLTLPSALHPEYPDDGTDAAGGEMLDEWMLKEAQWAAQ